MASINSLLLLISGIHPNPGPSLNKMKRFSFGMWNLDSPPSRKFSKIPNWTEEATYEAAIESM